MSLPKFVAFQTIDNGRVRYLGNIDDNDPSIKGFLAYTIEEASSPLARFEIEIVEDGLVQIRSCFTKKLWARSSSKENWMVTSSSEEVMDKTNWRCTLFKPVIEGTTVTFTHVQLQKKLVLKSTDHGSGEYLCVDSGDNSVKMHVVEPMVKRTIEVTRLRTEDFIFLSNSYDTVDTKTVDNDQMVEFKSEALETLEWSKSDSMVTEASFSIKSPTPCYDLARNCFIASDKIYKNDDCKWGTKQEYSFPVTQRIPIMVPPGMTKIIVRLRARSIRFQIPFDYIQTDTIDLTGLTKTCTNLRDGLYTGEFYSDFYIEAENDQKPPLFT